MAFYDTNAQESRALLEAKITEQMALRRAGEPSFAGGIQATNQNELQEEMANVTQTDSRDDDDGIGNAQSSSRNVSGISGIAEDATKISSGAQALQKQT